MKQGYAFTELMIRFRNDRFTVDLCDDCIEELNEWLGFKKDKEEK